MTTTVQTSSEIRQQIDQLHREIADINRSLPQITRTQDLLGAKSELTARAEVIVLLQSRLEAAVQHERVQAEQDKRTALENDRDAAAEEHNRLTEDFDKIMLPLEQEVLDALDRLDRIAWERSAASNRYAAACFELKGSTTSYGTSDELSTAYGWRVVNENDPTGVRRALFPLYASRHKGMPGSFSDLAAGLQMKQQADKAYDDLLNTPRPQQAQDNSFQNALDAETNRYFKPNEL